MTLKGFKKSLKEKLSLLQYINVEYGKNESTNRWDDLGDYALNKKATLEEGKEYLKLINLRFYELVPVSLGRSVALILSPRFL